MSPATSPESNRRWWALGLIAAAQFMVIMDTSIIGVALPKMQTDLGFAPQDLSWVFNAYVVAFGGLLLLGGRLSDLLGARRVFIAGWAVLLAGSVVAGAAGNAGVELAGRAVQGAGAALIAPSALTLLMVLFAGNGKELTKALALYGAAAPAGGTAGVFLGGVLTEYASWPWVFYLNIPIALAVIALATRVMPDVPGSRGRLDWVGAATVTGGLAGLVYAIVRAPEVGWSSAQTLLVGAGALTLLGLFLVMQAKRRQPLVRLGIFRTPALGAANVAQFLLGAAWVADVVLPESLPAAGARPVRVPVRVGAAADDGVHHGRHGARRPARHREVRPEAGPGRRHGCARGRARAARPGPPGRQLRRRRAARVAGRGGRDEPRVHPVPGYRPVLGPPRGGRAGGRHREHQLPGRVRARPGGDDRRGGRERRRPARRRVLADRRLLGRVPRRRRRRRRRRGHRRRHPAAAEAAAARRPRAETEAVAA